MTDEARVVTLEAPSNAVRKSIVVEVAQERAFKVFTEEIDSWWPRSHHIGSSALDKFFLEGREGGRWYGRGVDGEEADAGYVIAWEPPERVLLAWQITAEWKCDPSFVTEVEVLFVPESPERTRVELEHRNLDRFGQKEIEMRSAFEGPGGWTGMLEQFAKEAESG